jgi:hypothetical protein
LTEKETQEAEGPTLIFRNHNRFLVFANSFDIYEGRTIPERQIRKAP